jgi:hypothetical protein
MKRLTIAILLLFSSLLTNAQITTANLRGYVSDQNHEFLLGATVTATHDPSGMRHATVTDKNGGYHLFNLIPGGPYSVEIRSMGFQTKTIHDIYLALGEDKLLNVTLLTDSISLSEITIAVPAVIHDETSSVMTTINVEEITSLPTVERSLNDLIALTPQASSTTNGLAIGGGNYRQSYVTVDGASFHNSYGIGNNLPANGTPIALDAIEAMSISIAPYDVRQNGFTGGMVNAITKRGSNNLKVNVYDFFTNDKLHGTEYGVENAQGQYPERLKLNQSVQNITGFSVGGPIVKNKLFYFVNFEYQYDIEQGQTRYARENELFPWSGSTQYNRPTIQKMNEIRQYLIDTYGYDPGAYQNYSFYTPDYRLLARLDWNINKDHRLQLRFTDARYQAFSTPSASITPLSSSLYNKNSYGRLSDYAMYFESSSYYQQRNFRSAAAELNSRFLNGQLNNTLRLVYSLQHEPRKMTRPLFPTVDILEPLEDGTKAVYTSFGPDPFTYGTGSEVHNFIATDELGYAFGIHHVVGGLQFEFDKTTNRFMQGGAGYYVYNSWDDFVNHATPAAFTIAYGNNEKHEQEATSFNFFQNSLYAQDEMTFSEHFKMTAGLRLELPYYPSIVDYNINQEFQHGWDNYVYSYDTAGVVIDSTFTHHAIADGNNSLSGLSTADMPKTRVDFSPRLGFEWDILGNNKLKLYGGTGIYTGRLPLVWIVTTVCNSNVAQGTYLTYNKPIGFYSSVDEIIANNSSLLKIGDLPASQIATILDKSLRMPQTWKSSLTLEATLPGDIHGRLEGVYSKDLASVAVTRLGMIQGDSIQLPGEPGKRASWISEGIKNSIGGTINPFLITNSERNGYYYSITGQVSKAFPFGLSLTAAYTYAVGKNVTDGIGDQVMTAFATNTFGVHGSNSHELGYSSYVAPHRVLLNAAWTWKTGKRTTESIGLYYTGFNHAFVGSYSYTRYSYTMSGNVNGDGGSNSLIYIPTEEQLLHSLVNEYVSKENAAAFNEFIKNDRYLNKHRGEYATRGAAIAPWRNLINIKYERSIQFCNGHTLSGSIDLNNVANLLYRGWGNIERLSSSDILTWKDGKYHFNQPEWNPYAGTLSTWSAMLGLRYSF